MKAKDLKKGDFFRFSYETSIPLPDEVLLVTEVYFNKIVSLDLHSGQRRECTHMEMSVTSLEVKLQVTPKLTLKDLAPGDVFRIPGFHNKYVKLGGEDTGMCAQISVDNRSFIREDSKAEKTSLAED